MKICILSQNRNLYSTKRLVEAAEINGHQVKVVNPELCYININDKDPAVHIKGHEMEVFDAIIPRIGSSITFFGTAVLRHFEHLGVFVLNTAVSISRSRDKLRAHQLMTRKGINMPITGFAHSTDSTEDVINMIGGAPLIIKLLEGTQGKGVVLVETKKAAESVINAFRNLDAYFLVQKYIKESNGSDIRCIVLDNKVIASMKRTAAPGDFRSNLHAGGYAEEVKITPEERKMSIDAAKALGIKLGGVDLVRSDSGPMVLEVNSSPGLEGIERTTNVDIADKVIKYIEKRVNARKASNK